MLNKKESGALETKKVKRKRTPAEIFAILMASSFTVYILFYIFYGQASFVDVFMLRTQDLFMDFFNSVRDASQGAEVYTDRHVIYPPMANLIYLICSRFIPSAYNHSEWVNRLDWIKYTEAIFFIVLFTLFFVIILYSLFREFIAGGKKSKLAFAFFAVFNVPVLYMLERGNMILFCFISLMIYAFTYNSENKVYREIGLIALAFAFSIKLYPVIFGWFLLVDKRFKEAIRCAVYGVLMLIIPSFFFGGPACFVEIFKNITSFSSGSSVNSISVIAGYSGIPYAVWNALAYVWCFVCIACFAAAPFIHKEKWKLWMLGIIVILVVPSLTSIYVWAFMLIPIILLSNSGNLKKKDWFFFAVMASLFVFTILRFNFFLTFNSLLLYPVAAILSITAVSDTVISGVRKYKAFAKAKKEAV
ncbi:MAG: DUF2029 domain-containing protein [Clostridia bacterium]|nr:DUF2029 domain-containing protein [Clostridia bacterium]